VSRNLPILRARSTEDQAILLEVVRSLGALDKNFRYRFGDDSAAHPRRPTPESGLFKKST
jgi:hypothetical protein